MSNDLDGLGHGCNPTGPGNYASTATIVGFGGSGLTDFISRRNSMSTVS
jgi:hypothetical protein